MAQRDFKMLQTSLCTAAIFISLLPLSLAVKGGVRPNILVHETAISELNFNYTRNLATSTQPPIVTWSQLTHDGKYHIGTYWNGSSDVADKFSSRMDIIDSGKLRINSTVRGDAGRYECELQILDDQPFISTVVVNLTVLYLDTPVINSTKNIVEGDLLEIFCSVGAAYPDPIITLYNGQQLVASTTGTSLEHIVSNATRNNTGEYICSATNDAGSKDSDTMRIHIDYLDMPAINSPKNVVEGDLLEIVCFVAAYPDPILTLYKDQQQVNATTGTILKHTISNATSNDTGEYICSATNDVGSKDSDTMRIHVDYSNRTKEDQEDTCRKQPKTRVSVIGVGILIALMIFLVIVVFSSIVEKIFLKSKKQEEKNQGDDDPEAQNVNEMN